MARRLFTAIGRESALFRSTPIDDKNFTPSFDRRLFPPNLYKGSLFLGGGNNKVFYVGAQDQYYTYTMFDQSSLWTRNVIMGDIQLPSHAAMVADANTWLAREEKNKDGHDEIRFQVPLIWVDQDTWGVS